MTKPDPNQAFTATILGTVTENSIRQPTSADIEISQVSASARVSNTVRSIHYDSGLVETCQSDEQMISQLDQANMPAEAKFTNNTMEEDELGSLLATLPKEIQDSVFNQTSPTNPGRQTQHLNEVRQHQLEQIL